MGNAAVRVSRDGYVATLALDGPTEANRLDAALGAAIADACATLGGDDSVRAVVLTGTDGVFATGLSAPPVGGPAAAVAALAKPTIAWIEGDCLDQGLALALACDIRVAGAATFGMRHAASGLLPQDGGVQRLSRLVGRGQALRLLLTGEVISEVEALRIGLVELAGGRERAMELAQRVAAAAPIAAAYGKEAVHAGLDAGLEAGLRLEADLSVLLHATSDRAAGLRSFRDGTRSRFEGPRPRFEGR